MPKPENWELIPCCGTGLTMEPRVETGCDPLGTECCKVVSLPRNGRGRVFKNLFVKEHSIDHDVQRLDIRARSPETSCDLGAEGPCTSSQTELVSIRQGWSKVEVTVSHVGRCERIRNWSQKSWV